MLSLVAKPEGLKGFAPGAFYNFCENNLSERGNTEKQDKGRNLNQEKFSKRENSMFCVT